MLIRGVRGGKLIVVSLIFAGICIGLHQALAKQSTAYTDPLYFTSVPWETNSHWIQNWRGYTETVSAATFVDGTGVNFNADATQAENVATMLAKYGFHHARLELGWGSFAFDDEDRLNDPLFTARLLALKRHGIRPLILLNGNSRAPCPLRSVRRHVIESADVGARSIQLDNTDGLIPNYSGLSRIGSVDAANILFVSIAGNTVTLSKPLPSKLNAGTTVNIATLKYRPFGVPGSEEFAETLQGWQRYVINVARLARKELGTTGSLDGGFDIEIWNELTFGSSFLSLNNYYLPAVGSIPSHLVWSEIVNATASTAALHSDLFSGVLIGDGFANTVPWRASSTEPPRIDAIDKHPYQSLSTFPASEQNDVHLNADFANDNYVPHYRVTFPEYWATAIRTDNMLRDMSPINSEISGVVHGRFGRAINGKILPVTVWITEVNNDPERDDPAVTNDQALEIKGRTTSRYLAFFLNKGVTQIDFYAVQDRNQEFEDRAMSLVRNSFLNYAENPRASYPVNDTPYVSPALAITGRMVTKMLFHLDRHLTHLRPLKILSVTAKRNEVIVSGDGTPAHTDLRAVDVFAFLPFEVNTHRFVIPYYVMTRDVTKRLSEDLFTIHLDGFSSRALYSSYDPITDKSLAISSQASADGIVLRLPTTDYPRLLIVDDRVQSAE